MSAGISNPLRKFEKYKNLICYLCGIIIGTLLFNYFFRTIYRSQILTYGKYFFASINGENNKVIYLVTILIERIKELLLCILAVFTPFAGIISLGICIKYGIGIGMTVSMAVACFRSWGIPVFIVSVLPYGLIFVFYVYLLINFLNNTKNTSGNYISSVLLLIGVMIMEVFVETFVQWGISGI